MITIIVDADACPVVDIIERIAKLYNLNVIYVCDTAHNIKSDYLVITVDQGSDSADYKIVELTNKDNIVITQDYPLASLCLLKKAIVIHPNGYEITNLNINTLLQTRYLNQKARKAKQKVINPKKRSSDMDIDFEKVLINYLNKQCIE